MIPTNQAVSQNYPLAGYSRLTIQQEGLHVETKHFFKHTEVVLPYEELLPIGVARVHNFPIRLSLVVLFICFGCLKALYSLITEPEIRDSNALLLFILTGILVAVTAQCFRLWRHDFILTTGRGNVSLFDSQRNRASLHEFADTLRDHTIQLMRARYAVVDPLRAAGPQLERLEWLRNLGVLNGTQFQELEARLKHQKVNESILGNELGFRPSAN